MASAASGQHPLADRLAELCEQAPGLPHTHFGYKIIDADTGESLASGKSADLFTPASNNKLYTTAFALMRLGPQYRMRTEIRTQEADLPTNASVLPNLELVGGGDPNLSGRVVPYAAKTLEGDPTGPLRELAHALKSRGIVSVNGDVIGSEGPFPHYPDGWAIDDMPFEFGAPVSLLTVNDSTIALVLRPTEDGELVDIQLRPAVPHFVLLNRVVTVANGKTDLRVEHPLGSNEVILTGTLSGNAGEVRADLAVEDPALFAAECMRDAIADEGIVVRGEARAGGDEPGTGTILATRESAPLSDVIQITNKVSQNLHAEMLLRVAALANGPDADPLSERQKFLDSIGITREGSGYLATDGSGLARQDKASPDATVALLRFMWRSPYKDVWLASLPIGGVDGTLEHRFQGITGANRVHAKTGSLGHVDTLSGYLQTQSGRWLAFSLMVDATIAPDRDIRAFLDSFCAAMLDQ